MLAPGQASSISDADVVSYFDRYSNWGRWGDRDTHGTMNLMTAERVVDAAKLVETGIHIGCSRPIGYRPDPLAMRSVIHLMTRSGADNSDEGMGAATDWIGVGLHGMEYTHLDSHSHFFWNGQMYNGRSKDLVTAEKGALAGGLEPTFDGIVGRGVLVDGPAMNGGQALEPGSAIEARDLDAWYSGRGLEPRPGDVVYVRTGNGASDSESFAGLDASCIPWLHTYDVGVLVSDAIHDVVPSSCRIAANPLHGVGLVAIGLWLIDNAALDRLAAMCSELRRYEFFTVATPLRLARATGSLIDPIAIF
jgi:kynurenine formamidase